MKSFYDARRGVMGAALHLASTLLGPEDETTSAHYDASLELGEDMLDDAIVEYMMAKDPAATEVGTYTHGARLIARERLRQISREGYTPEHDAEHNMGELVRAAISYAYTGMHGNANTQPDPEWPWDRESWKPSDDRIRSLVKAGALIAAEIDRVGLQIAREQEAIDRG